MNGTELTTNWDWVKCEDGSRRVVVIWFYWQSAFVHCRCHLIYTHIYYAFNWQNRTYIFNFLLFSSECCHFYYDENTRRVADAVPRRFYLGPSAEHLLPFHVLLLLLLRMRRLPGERSFSISKAGCVTIPLPATGTASLVWGGHADQIESCAFLQINFKD